MARFQFPEWTDGLKRWVLLLAAGGPVFLVAFVYAYADPQTLRIGYQPQQPVPYSHARHGGELGIDCRYCHGTVEQAGHSSIPTAEMCMNCHAAIPTIDPITGVDRLAPVRDSFETGSVVPWVRVHDLPDYVYFNHSAHVTRGVGCESCHGRVDQMEVVYQAQALTMEWCLNCHRDPYLYLRPLSEITTMGYAPSGDRREHGRQVAQTEHANKINPREDCSTCHR